MARLVLVNGIRSMIELSEAVRNKRLTKPLLRFIFSLAVVVILVLSLLVINVNASDPGISIQINGAETEQERIEALDILLLLTIIALLPSILIMMTSFTRIIIVLSLLRNAMGLQQTPPNQVLIGLALFLSLFIMSPVISSIEQVAYTPYVEGSITQEEAIEKASVPLKEFMLKQTYRTDLNLFRTLAEQERPDSYEELSMTVVIPAFITSELKRGFTMGFFLYIPFLVIDMVVASTLMSMGMIMLSPVTISMPFKILLFVLVDGWGMTVKTLIASFN